MQPRERILSALRHQIPDRVPFDLRMSVPSINLHEEKMGTRDVSEYIQADYRFARVIPPQQLPDFSTYFRERVPSWPEVEWREFSPQLVPESTQPPYPHFFQINESTLLNEWGEYRIFDSEGVYHHKIYPLNKPDCSLAEIEAYPFPDLSDEMRYVGVAEHIQELHEHELAAAVFMEMTIFEKAWRIRSMENLLMDMLANPAVAECLFENIAERTGYFARRYAELGIDILCMGDDVGAETRMMMSPSLWRKLIKPQLKKVVEGAKQANPQVLVYYHSDGKIDPIIPDLIDIGVDILNPIQPETMDITEVKKKYGDNLSFWGGIGVQTTLPFGTPQDVDLAVKNLIAQAGEGGGLLVAPSHVVEQDVPWENISAFLSAVRKYGFYE
jgi:uroporphyrinogen decarboxylase